MRAAPKLQSRKRSDPSLTFAKLGDVLSNHCGIVTSVQPLGQRAAALGGAFGYAAQVESLTLLGNDVLRERRTTSPDAWRESAEGRAGTRVAYDRTRAFARAVGEALERYASCLYDPADLVTGSYHEIAPQGAIHPHAFQLPDAEEYAHLPELSPFQDEAPARWARAWSVRDEAWQVAPAQMVHLMYNPLPGEPRFVPTTSTGWAIHHTREEAIHAGLRETIERDAFAIHWLNKMHPPAVDLADAGPEVERFVARIARDGATLHARSLTTDIGIAVFAIMIVDERAGRPAFCLTTAAHPNPRRGLLQAIEEAAMIHHHAKRRARELPPAKPATEISSMADHQDHYLRQENLVTLAPLLDARGASVALSDLPDFASDDVWAETRAMVNALARAGLDTLYVDGTPPDLRKAGWHAAKVLVPGAARHEYGYGVRLLACPRIYNAPVAMHKRTRPATRDELNTEPHPYA